MFTPAEEEHQLQRETLKLFCTSGLRLSYETMHLKPILILTNTIKGNIHIVSNAMDITKVML